MGRQNHRFGCTSFRRYTSRCRSAKNFGEGGVCPVGRLMCSRYRNPRRALAEHSSHQTTGVWGNTSEILSGSRFSVATSRCSDQMGQSTSSQAIVRPSLTVVFPIPTASSGSVMRPPFFAHQSGPRDVQKPAPVHPDHLPAGDLNAKSQALSASVTLPGRLARSAACR